MRYQLARSGGSGAVYESGSVTPKGTVRVVAPVRLSLIENPEETLEFFSSVLKSVSRRREVFLDLSGIEVLTTDAVMCLLSAIEATRGGGKRTKMSGNYPVADECNRLLVDSGFYGFVYTATPLGVTVNNEDIYAIASGSKVDPNQASEVKAFAVDHLGIEAGSSEAKKLYTSIIECMANTRNHAYGDERKTKRKWWLMAHYRPESCTVSFTFVDNGLGIPATVRRKFADAVRTTARALSVSPRSQYIDADLIESAMKGEHRTKTRLEHRGKGLRSIYDGAKDGHLLRLQVISRHGMVDCTEDSKRRLSGAFEGTLVFWDVSGTRKPHDE